jgi:hypothetical protein
VAQNKEEFGLWGPLLPIIPIWSSESEDLFWILITLPPKPWDLNFDPNKIILETAHGDALRTKGFVGPYESSVFNAKSLLDAHSLSTVATPFPITSKVVVGVLFETKTIAPDRPFSLTLKGLYRGAQPIDVSILKFKRQRTRYLDVDFFNPLCPHCGPIFHKSWIVNE